MIEQKYGQGESMVRAKARNNKAGIGYKMCGFQHKVAQPHTSGRTASNVRSHSLKRQVAQPQTTGRSASCDRSLSVTRQVAKRRATGR
ncbi:MAG: hypothetical protein K6A32_03895 [Bacteroidales bacterium]|nr:hypothetical protein [Bacteroidales bacterium]